MAVIVATAGVAATEATASEPTEADAADADQLAAPPESVCKYANLAALEAYGLPGGEYAKLIGQPTELPSAREAPTLSLTLSLARSLTLPLARSLTPARTLTQTLTLTRTRTRTLALTN